MKNITKHMETYPKHPTYKQIHAARKSDPCRAEIQSMPRGRPQDRAIFELLFSTV